MHRVLATLVLLVLLPTSVASAKPPAKPVTTKVSWPISPQGSMSVQFSATPATNGQWSVSATFKPSNVSLDICTPAYGCRTYRLSGTATEQAVATPEVAVHMTADGLYWASRAAPALPTIVDCTFTVGADGKVAVSFLSVFVPTGLD